MSRQGLRGRCGWPFAAPVSPYAQRLYGSLQPAPRAAAPCLLQEGNLPPSMVPKHNTDGQEGGEGRCPACCRIAERGCA